MITLARYTCVGRSDNLKLMTETRSVDASESNVLRQVAARYRSSAAKDTDVHRVLLLQEIAQQLEADAAKLEAERASW